MKKIILLFVLMLTFAVSGMADEQSVNKDSRNLSTPAARLLGHWSNELEEHYYFGEIDDGVGNYIIVPPGGKALFHKYKIIGQDPEGEKIDVVLLLLNGDKRNEKYFVSQDGKELQKVSEYRGVEVVTKRYYVDEKQKP